MAKCSRCGRDGLFFKVNKDTGLCIDCQAVLDNEQALNKLKREIEENQQRLGHLHMRIEQARAERDQLITEYQQAHADLDALIKRCKKIKSIPNSIKYAQQQWVDGNTSEAIAQIDSLEIEDLLPEPDLNCLTMKALRSRYYALKKQIVDLCKANEARYTTKTNAALYKLMVLAMESELENVLYKLQFGKLENGIAAVKTMTMRYYQIAADGNQNIAPTLQRFIGQIESLYLEVVATEYEYYVQRERAKEEQRALREQMRQEAEERKQLEQEKKKIEAEERKYQQEIERIELELKTAHDQEIEALRKRLEEITTLMNEVEAKKAEIVNLQNGKAGTVYIISNIGSFGDDVFKIGMTRRLEPEDRVNELGSASVPFPFDIHSFIFSEDAPALEAALHHELNDRRVNKVNLRKEFFRVSVEELQQMVERYDPTAAFRVTALAEQYRQSLSITDVPEGIVLSDDDEEDDE